MTEYHVSVPARTVTSFKVQAKSPRAAKREVNRWLRGVRDDGDDLVMVEEPGQTCWNFGTRAWTVTS